LSGWEGSNNANKRIKTVAIDRGMRIGVDTSCKLLVNCYMIVLSVCVRFACDIRARVLLGLGFG